MSKSGINPVIFAENQLNELVNSHSTFTFTAWVRFPFQTFTLLHEYRGLDLIQQVDGLNGEMSRVWFHRDSDSYFLLRDVTCIDETSCHQCHSRIVICSKTHEGLAKAIQIFEGIDDGALDELITKLLTEGD